MPHPVLRCDPKLFDKDLTNQVIIVTGANSGCGLETSRQLAKQGATIILACRNAERGEAAAADVKGTFLVPLDLSSLQSIKDFVTAFEEEYDRLDALVNNAGIMACPFEKTEDGFEMQFGCNHLGHFLLMHLLIPMLLETAEKTGKPSRFISLSSCAAANVTMTTDTYADIDFDDLNWQNREYNEQVAYSQSKLSNHLHALGASMKYPADKIICTSVHPGWVLSPLDQHVTNKMIGTGYFAGLITGILKYLFLWKGDMLSPADGAQATLHCLLANDVESGKFYSQKGVYEDEASKAGGWPMELPNPNATPDAASKLWTASAKLVGI